jgi:hypothetical protein
MQKSLSTHNCQKLSFCFFGPYQTKHLVGVGVVAYKLKLPEHVKLHLVVHDSVLKVSLPPNQVSQPPSLFLNAGVGRYQVPELCKKDPK